MSLTMPTQLANQEPGAGQGGIWIPAVPPLTNELVILAPMGALSFTRATLGEHSPPAVDSIFIGRWFYKQNICIWAEVMDSSGNYSMRGLESLNFDGFANSRSILVLVCIKMKVRSIFIMAL